MFKSTKYIENPVNSHRLPLFNMLFKSRVKRLNRLYPKGKKERERESEVGTRNVESRICWLRGMDWRVKSEEWRVKLRRYDMIWFKLCMYGTLIWRFKHLSLSLSGCLSLWTFTNSHKIPAHSPPTLQFYIPIWCLLLPILSLHYFISILDFF